jgi:para-aminobenzoate synthetase component 1
MPSLEIKEWNGESLLKCAESLSSLPYTLFFDSNRPEHPSSQWSFLCWSPVQTITAKNGVITHNDKVVGKGDVFEFIQNCLNEYNFTDDVNIPFTGGAAGYWGYDLGRQIEDIHENTLDDINAPDMMVGIYTNILAHDHKADKTWLIGEAPELPIVSMPYRASPIKWEAQKSEENYKKDIQTVIDYIYAGEVYQVNISRRFDADLPDDFTPFTHYKHLREINPAPFSAYMNFGSLQLSSCSPERFIKCDGVDIETQPIKGTLPSHQSADILISSKKDRAENTMIVDLLRNDLSKVCDYHSVKVPELCALETFEALHHLVSTVRGILKPENKPTDVLRACFPGGSITGAPKIRAMHIIEKLEETRRGPYCGAMGYIGFNGHMDTNIAIRTLIYANGKVYLQTGSGIVSDSIPTKELQESLDKAAKIFESFETKKDAA